MDLLNWTPPETVVRRFDDARVRAADLRSKIARAVAEALSDTPLDRKEIARRASEWLGETISPAMLNKYASPSSDDHPLPLAKFLAIVAATEDPRLLQVFAEMFGWSVIDDRYLPWVEVGQLADAKEEFDKAYAAARAKTRRVGK
ncbi:MAG: DNA transposition protein [Magnetospiraceae bacterium]